MNKFQVFAIICFFFLFSFGACKKSAHNSVQHDDITGKWRKTRSAIDTNGNGIIDNNELLAPDTYDSTHILIFNNDGTGEITYMNTNVATFSWSLENNNTYLKIYYAGSITGLTYQHLDTLTYAAMTLRDTTGMSIVWSLYTKQLL